MKITDALMKIRTDLQAEIHRINALDQELLPLIRVAAALDKIALDIDKLERAMDAIVLEAAQTAQARHAAMPK